MRIDATKVHYKDLNEDINQGVAAGETEFILDNIKGQRYIGVGIPEGVEITINGVPGQDLGAFMNGAVVRVNGNVQDGTANTMNKGKIVVRGDAGDITGYAMRGGKLFIRGHVGYRTGIHMKAFHELFPTVVVGDNAQDYLGEYMAGGVLIVLNLKDRENPTGHFVGAGMHGGAMYIRGKLEDFQVGAEVGFMEPNDEEWAYLQEVTKDFFQEMEMEPRVFEKSEFVKLYPKSARPYGNMYSY